MAKGDKINVNLQKLEGSMQGIMSQMGLGVNIVGGGSQGAPKKDKAKKKSVKSPQGERGAGKPGDNSNLGNQAAAKPGGTGNKVPDSKPGKKEEKKTSDVSDNRRKP
jgi:hypothetical protein